MTKSEYRAYNFATLETGEESRVDERNKKIMEEIDRK